ncbi:MAG TPA: hypothetical protein PLM93_08510 [Sulfuricurvum sp.]|nr:MAG: hypothetical protein B7Y30_10520 [Campylobacterales bacterium 16-40-21]OZA02837.1 MAG: hypothetical protein B7X89_07080 [Sulfuricurvum sp. 17-40-25]HQS67209.1 hypothetical protein [Sulfuricurvum sp.]HQT37411.1 hypothetical protein [Sulfuricurvum sp.]
MLFSWSNTNLGGKIILISTVIATISMFLPWVDMVTRYTTGFQEYAFALLLLYIYPVVQTIRNQSISLVFGSLTSIIAAVAAVAFMEYKTIPFEGVNLCFAGQGTYLFFAASVFLFAGILKYKPAPLTAVESAEIQ